MISKYLPVVFLATMLAVLVVLVAEPEDAGAARTDEVTTTEVSAATVRGCTGGDVSLSADEKRMLDLHNKTRAEHGLPKFCVHPALQRAARAHSKEMIDKDYFKHNSASGQKFWHRLESFGYNWWTAGENILYDPGSQDSAESLFKVWMKSSDHRANILDKRFREIGVGASTGSYKGGRATMWTVHFGDR
jgi:uncharacterized protein YkwD